MRVLHEDDLRWITGGACDSNAYHTESCGESDCTRVEQVVVTACRHDEDCPHTSPYPDASDEPEHPPEEENPEEEEEEPAPPPPPPPPPPTDCSTIDDNWDTAANNRPYAPEIKADLANAKETHSDRMRGMPAGLEIDDPNSTSPFTTGAELKKLWSKMDMEVIGTVDPNDAANGWGGYAERNGGNPILTVDVNNLVSYMASETNRAWYFFHEIVHTTVNGKAMYDAAHTSWYNSSERLNGVAWGENSTYFKDNEKVVNTIAANIALQFGIDLRSGYPDKHGYLPSSAYAVSGTSGSITPDTAGTGPGGTCSS